MHFCFKGHLYKMVEIEVHKWIIHPQSEWQQSLTMQFFFIINSLIAHYRPTKITQFHGHETVFGITLYHWQIIIAQCKRAHLKALHHPCKYELVNNSFTKSNASFAIIDHLWVGLYCGKSLWSVSLLQKGKCFGKYQFVPFVLLV